MEQASTLESSSPASSSGHAERFFINVLWTWIGVGANLFAAFFLTRYIIHKLGVERYGIWTLAFALIDYFWFFDLGLRSAVVNGASRFRAQGETQKINEVINTGLCYFCGISLALLILSISLSGRVYRLFQIDPALRGEFSRLILLVGVSLSAGVACCVFQAGLEAFQRFKVYNHIAIAVMIVRVAGCWAVLAFGYGIVAMGAVVVVSQFSAYAMTFAAFRRAFPELRFSLSLASRTRLKEMTGYGVPSFFANSATLALNQGPPALIGHFHPEAFVAYYSLPLRLLQYSVDAIMRIGFVTAPNTAEMIASGRREYVAKLGMYLNRYCLTLFLPFSAFLWIYGGEMITVWVGEVLAAHSAPLLPAFILGATLAQAAQFNSSSILFGMARHGSYAISLVLEAAVMIAGVSLLTPQYGIVAVAWVSSTLMILNRGFVTPWVVCRNLEFPFSRYMTSIYVRPALSLVPAVCLSLWIKSRWLPGRNWPELSAALGLIAVTHYASAYFSCVEPEHRILLRQWVLQRLPLLGRRGRA